MLKKLLCFILSALLLCACLPASAEDAASPYVDIWIENSGYGTLILFADGTSIMTYFDDTTTECHWEVTQEGARFTDGQWLNSPMELLDENTLSVSNGWAVFTRQGAEPSGVELNATPVGEEGAPFFGTWTLDSLSFDGESYSAATFGMNMVITLNQDGTAISQEDTLSETTTWYAENGYAVVDGLLFSINADGQLVVEEDGAMMIFQRGEDGSPAEELSEEEMLLALLAMMDQLNADEQDLSALPEALQGFVGEWYMVYTATGGLTGDLRTMGVTCTLTLNADGTGSIDFPTYEDATWYDDEGIVQDAQIAKNLGFTGKASISPRHVEVINAVFSPTQQEVDYAYEVMEAIALAKSQGKGAISLRGKMIDAPIVTRAERTIAMAEALGMERGN